MVYEVVDLIIAVDQRSAIFWLRFWISEECYRCLVVWDLTNRYLRLYVHRLSLRGGNSAEGLDLSVVEACWLAKACKTHRARVDTVKLR